MQINGLNPTMNNDVLGVVGNQNEKPDEKLFLGALKNVEQTQNEANNSIVQTLTTGEGAGHEALIEMMKAEHTLKTSAMVRDKFIENYNQLMNIQI